MKLTKGNPCSAIVARLTRGQIAIDVGAGEGQETAVMADCVGPTGHVYSFEPDPRCWEKLAIKAAGQPVTVYHEAAAALDGETLFYQSKVSDQSSLYAPLTRDATSRVTRMRRLDDLPVDRVDLVKLDAQGAEMAILDGAERILALCPWWIVECWPHGLQVAGSSANALIQRFWDRGFTVSLCQHPEPLTLEMITAWLGKVNDKNYINLEARR